MLTAYIKMTNMNLKFVVFGLMNCFVFGYQRENIALFKDSKQSTTLGFSTSNYAVDGVLTQNHQNHRCTHTYGDQEYFTNVEEYQWWAVDLGTLYNIETISIYNRKDCCSERLTDYSVFIYNPVVSSWSTFAANPAVLCYFHPGQSPGIINLTCNKKTKGRYVQIYKSIYPSNALTLCEVQVFGSVGKPGAHFCKAVSKRPMQLTRTIDGMTELRCAFTCLSEDNCLGYILRSDGICDLYQTSQTVATPDNEVGYYETC